LHVLLARLFLSRGKESSNPTSVAAFKRFCPEATVLAKKYGNKNQQRDKNFNKTITSLALFGCEVILTKLEPLTSSLLVIYQLTSIAQSLK